MSNESPKEQPTTALIFLHFFGGSSRTWSEVLERLAKSEPSIRCLAPDLRGFGSAGPGESTETGSGVSEDIAGYDVDDYAGEVSDLTERIGVERYFLVGHSMGGKIALALASRRPPGLLGVLLAAPSPPSPEPMTDEAREQLRGARDDASIASQVVLSATAKPLSHEIHDRTVEDFLSSSPTAWNAWLDTGSRKDLAVRVTNINVPVVVLAGGHDPVLTPALLKREIVERIHGSRLILVPDSAHLMPLDSPAAISGHIRDFVRSLNARQSASRQAPAASYPLNTVRNLLSTDLVTGATRRTLTERIAKAPAERAVFFEDGLFRTLSAVCARIISQVTDEETVDIAGEIDMRLSQGEGNGWRYDDLPPDGEAYRIGLRGLDETAHVRSGNIFASLDSVEQDAVLFAVQQNRVSGGAWALISPARFFEELLAEASEIYFSHPIAQERIGYTGMADKRGWQNISLNTLDPQEPRSLEPRNA